MTNTDEEQIYTLLDVVPEMNMSNQKEIYRQSQEIIEFFSEHGKTKYSGDEIGFIMVLDHYIKVFEKAKTMIGKCDMTVEYMPSDRKIPKIEDFKIVSLKSDTKVK